MLQYLTIGHGLLESVVTITAAAGTGSVVLLGFGLDSLIELCSAAIVIWRLSVHSHARRSAVADAVGLRFVGICFVLLSAYVAYDSVLALVRREVPSESIPGIAIAALSVVVMPLLARAKRRLATEINSSALRADSTQSDFCAYLSGILLVGLVLNAKLGWWWADPAAALVMTPIIFREGILALRGQACGCDHCAVAPVASN